jgi:hypothetical protein
VLAGGSIDLLLTDAARLANIDFAVPDGVVHKPAGRHIRVDAVAPAGTAAARQCGEKFSRQIRPR